MCAVIELLELKKQPLLNVDTAFGMNVVLGTPSYCEEKKESASKAYTRKCLPPGYFLMNWFTDDSISRALKSRRITSLGPFHGARERF